MNERDLFISALELETPEERAAWLDSACKDDAELRRRIELLLRVHEKAGRALEDPVVAQLVAAAAEPDDPMRTSPAAIALDDPAPPLDFLSPSENPSHLGKLGPYEVLEMVGRGGMGVVLKAFDPSLHRLIAIKVIAPALAASPAARARFEREARAVAAVRNEHVVGIYAVEMNASPPYLVMEFIGGSSLQQRLDSTGPLELKEILRIAHQAACGLAAAHALGIVHRDIKPANILLENGVERVKLTDFGVARATDDASLTQSGVIAGTPQYMSPEQADGKSVDHRSDLFSLGSVMYAMCTGHPPFRAAGVAAVLNRVANDEPRAVTDVNPDIPDWLEDIIVKLHAKEPDSRFQSASELAALLGQYLAHLQQPSVVPMPEDEPVPVQPVATPPRVPRRKPIEDRRWPDQQSSEDHQAEPWGNIWRLVSMLIPIGLVALTTIRFQFAGQYGIGGWQVWTIIGLVMAVLAAVGAFSWRRYSQRRIHRSSSRGNLFVWLVPLLLLVPVIVWLARSDLSGRSGSSRYLPAGTLMTIKWYDPDHDLVVSYSNGSEETIQATGARPVNGPVQASRFVPPGDYLLRVYRQKEVVFHKLVTVVGNQAVEFEVPNLPPGLPTEWMSIFDGESLEGWRKHDAHGSQWSVEQGVLVGRSGYLFTNRNDFENFHLWAEVQVNEGGDAGIFVRSPFDFSERPNQRGIPQGHEVEISGRAASTTGSLIRRQAEAASVTAAKPIGRPGDWITLEILARGSSIAVRVNGRPAVNTVDPSSTFRRGHVVLQAVGPNTSLRVRQIRIKEAPAGPILLTADAPFPAETARWHQEQWAQHLMREKVDPNSLGMKMVLIPPGEFSMGTSPEDAAELNRDWQVHLSHAPNPNPWRTWELGPVYGETPQHRVRITRPFYLSATEVTMAQFRQFAQAAPYATHAESTKQGGYTWNGVGSWMLLPEINWQNPGRSWKPTDDHPVVQVTRGDAEMFCRWLSKKENRTYRLPTEAEWEYACRAGTVSRYSFSDSGSELGRYGWAIESGIDHPQPVGKKLANPWGLFDMHGNVQEWCADGYQSQYRPALVVDPSGPAHRSPGVMRGGGWSNHAWMCRSACRLFAQPTQANDHTGFRVVCELPIEADSNGRRLVTALSLSTPTVAGLPAVRPDLGGWRIETARDGTIELFDLPGLEITGELTCLAKVRGQKLTADAKLVVQSVGTGLQAEAPIPAGDNDWLPIEVTLRPGNTPITQVKIQIAVGGKGTVWIKDVQLRQKASVPPKGP